MSPAFAVIPRPEPLPLPGPAWLFWALLMVTLALHVLAMNLLVGTSVMAAYLRIRHGSNSHAREMVRRLTPWISVCVAATVSFGVAPLLFVQVLYGRLFFTSSVLMGWAWLAVVPAVMAVYYTAHYASRRSRNGMPVSGMLFLGVALVLLAVGLTYSANMTLMLRAESFIDLYRTSAGGLHFGGGDATLWPRWLHMMLGATAVGGLTVALAGSTRRTSHPEFARWAVRTGATWATVATGLNVVSGAWWLGALPSATVQRFMGGSGAAAALLGASVILGLASFALLAGLASSRASPTLAGSSAAALVATIVTMLFVRDQVREAALERVGFEPVQWVVPQWLPFGLFAVLLLAAIGLIAWMARVLYVGEGTDSGVERT
jgi:hypothetical protein